MKIVNCRKVGRPTTDRQAMGEDSYIHGQTLVEIEYERLGEGNRQLTCSSYSPVNSRCDVIHMQATIEIFKLVEQIVVLLAMTREAIRKGRDRVVFSLYFILFLGDGCRNKGGADY